jgi:protein-tyrosine kinase
MTVNAFDDPGLDLAEELRANLIALCRLSDDDIERIESEMLARQVSFGEAAVACAAVTRRELDKATAWVQQIAERSRWGVIETALRKQPVGRTITLKYTATVKPGPQLALVHDPYSARSERIRGLRTELLLFDGKRGRANLLTVMSPGRGEGRSLLASELAIAFAQLGRRTLLVDADLRQPGLHTLFGADNTWGLAQALAFSESPRLLGVEGVPDLSLMTAGPVTPNPLELLSDGRFERQLTEWRSTFEYIIIDTPPVSDYSDALAIATLAGRVLVVSRATATTHRSMKEMLRRLGSTQAQILGAVMNYF